MVRGAISIAKGSEADKIRSENNKLIENVSKQSGLETNAYSFAEAFTRAYFTRYPNDTEFFKNNMLKYTSEDLANAMNNNGYSEVISVNAFKFAKYSDNQFNVSVQANLKQYVPKPGQEKVPKDKLAYDMSMVTECIEVPVYVDNNGNFSVDDMPVMIAEPFKAESPHKEYTGEVETDAEVLSKVNDALNQFFKAYYELDQTQIDYFLAEGANKISGTNGKFKLEKLDAVNVFRNGDNKYLATVELTINAYESQLKQRFNVTLVKQGDKYLINELNTRIFNLNIQK
ncbi:conjugal transfer protein (plasmid) [Clostridium baratii]